MGHSARHPGQHIKATVLPKGLSVKKAAALLGVGRPALSNLLNGNAALTQEMALRIEKAFGARIHDLLALQAAYDESLGREQAKEMAVRIYVPTFLGIEARQISAWAAGNIEARSHLPGLLRRLVHSTGSSFSRVDFPAYDNAQRHGWDGFISTDAATPWIPRGDSGWEFGCNQNPERKANEDFASRTASVSVEERRAITFVFVTPHNWPGKETWARAKRASAEWKDVRAYDASDLEQWLEQSVPTQTWFGDKIGNGAEGVLSLEACWNEWASASDPPLSKILFRAPVAASKERLENWLTRPPTAPFVITADSEGEALAFIACALEQISSLPGAFGDRALVLKTVAALKRATALAPNFVAIVSSPDVEAASAGLQTTHHLLIVRRRNDISGEGDINLDLVDDLTYREALAAMGLHEPDYERYARETANSPTILRRHLSNVPAIRAPAWSSNKTLARNLIPLSLAGVWDSETPSDREIIRCLAGREYAEIEQTVAELRTVPDAPMWSIARYRGVTSKIDVLFATHNLVTKKDIEDFFVVAQIVLSESDPALDLPQDKQWAANIYGKMREHSSALRLGLCETLVLLAAHGNTLFRERLGIDVQTRVDQIVGDLLLPLDGRTWASQKSDLPRYAEAAPDVFLEILEQDLASTDPKVHALLEPAESMPFGGCPRTGLLWALETLAWRPDRMLRVSLLLAKLAEVHITDNWSNKPEASLESIFRNWMPQTAASIDERNEAMEVICRRVPSVGWRLIINEFGSHHAIGHYSARPHWRNDASGAGQTVKTHGEIYRVADKARELALSWPTHNQHTLGDLVGRLEFMPETDHEKVWLLIKNWAATGVDDAARQQLRERIRKTAFTRRARIRGVTAPVVDRARDAYALLEPRDLIMRHLWLFTKHWVDESADELEDEDLGYEKCGARISLLRKSALTEIWQALGYEGILRLTELSQAESAIGRELSDGVVAEEDVLSFLDRLAEQSAPPAEIKIDNLLSGFLQCLDAQARGNIVRTLLQTYVVAGAIDKTVRLLTCAPFRAETWDHLESLPADWRIRYWSDAYVRWERQDEHEFDTLVASLLEVNRPRAAFSAVHMDFNKIGTKLLIDLMRSVATSSAEPAAHFQVEQYEVAEAFKSLKKRPEVAKAELAQLEFMYVPALEHSDYGIPTLQTVLSEDPQLFMQLVALVYRRMGDGEDPTEWKIANEEHRQNVATSAYGILHRLARFPGTQDDGSIDEAKLRSWIDSVRALGRQYGREAVTDSAIGQMLGRCPPDPDGVWPCEPVRQVLDGIESEKMALGVSIGRYNTRGVHFRGPNGNEERALAAQYRGWAKAVSYKYPFTAKLLEEMAGGYDKEAVWHDTEANVRKRLNH
ncbi:MAG TPA: HigA family addiction module antitoxin [Rhizomicrobium sp.]